MERRPTPAGTRIDPARIAAATVDTTANRQKLEYLQGQRELLLQQQGSNTRDIKNLTDNIATLRAADYSEVEIGLMEARVADLKREAPSYPGRIAEIEAQIRTLGG